MTIDNINRSLAEHFAKDLPDCYMANTQEIIEKLEPHIRDISYRTYFRKRQMAIDALSSVLWGYSSKESLALLEKFVPEG